MREPPECRQSPDVYVRCATAAFAVLLGGCTLESAPSGSTVGIEHAPLSVDSGTDAGPASPDIGSFALYATDAIELNSGSSVTGCNLGVESTTGPFIAGAAAYLNSGGKIQSSQTLYAYIARISIAGRL